MTAVHRMCVFDRGPIRETSQGSMDARHDSEECRQAMEEQKHHRAVLVRRAARRAVQRVTVVASKSDIVSSSFDS